MKNLISKILLLTLLIIATTCATYSQEPNSRNATASPTPAPTAERVKVSRNKTVSFLIEQNKNASEVIAAQEQRIKDLEAELETEKENSASLQTSYGKAQLEIEQLKLSNERLNFAIQKNEDTIRRLEEDNTKQRAKADKANKEKWKARAAAALAILSRFIRF